MKPRWRQEIDGGIEQLDEEVSRRRRISNVDPVADGIAYAVAEMKTRVATVSAPGRELSPSEWGAEQDPPVVEQTVRNWIRAGELEARVGPRGFLILASAERRAKAKE